MADAFEQVGPAVNLDSKVKRTTELLYVGSLEFSTSVEDLYLAVGGSDSDVVEWRTLQSQESMADRNMDSSSYRGHDVSHWIKQISAYSEMIDVNSISASCGKRTTSDSIPLMQHVRQRRIARAMKQPTTPAVTYKTVLRSRLHTTRRHRLLF
jgi:hypothetical protein